MKTYNIHEAKTHFSKIVAAVEAGETVTICRNGTPVASVIAPVAEKKIDNSHLFGAWGPLPEGSGDLEHMVGPTDDDLLDEMGL